MTDMFPEIRSDQQQRVEMVSHSPASHRTFAAVLTVDLPDLTPVTLTPKDLRRSFRLQISDDFGQWRWPAVKLSVAGSEVGGGRQ